MRLKLTAPHRHITRAAFIGKLMTTGALVYAAAMLGGCSPLRAYNLLTPSDKGAELAKSDIAYGSHPRQRLDVYTPAIRPERAPVVVVFYGGSWNSGSKDDYAFLGKALAARGYVTIVTDYRLVPEVHFPAFIDDGAQAVAWAYRNASAYGGDPTRLFLFGHSAGAYIAAMIALDNRYLKQTGLSPSIIAGVAGLAGPYDFLPLDGEITQATFAKAPSLPQTQPVTVATPAAPPMLLATGTADDTVRPRNTDALAQRLRDFGRSVTVKKYEGISHVGIMLATSVTFRNQAPVLADFDAFVASTPASRPHQPPGNWAR